ncbi:MAG: NusG domain II-containing protein [Lachnospiraceae bacterium]|nr:NusG domain II-containing protein [Lachnospiraceae bacterium]
MNRSLINKKEIAIIVLVLLVCFCTFLYYETKNNDSIAIITVNKEIYRKIDLTDNKDEYVIDIPSQGKYAHIKVSGNSIGFIHHECPDGICENAGMLSSPMHTAVCLPLKVSIVIENKNSNLDIISG